MESTPDFQQMSINSLRKRLEVLERKVGELADQAQTSKDELAAAALARIARANLSDPETDDLTVPLAIELSETQRRLYYMEEKYGKIDWDVALTRPNLKSEA